MSVYWNLETPAISSVLAGHNWNKESKNNFVFRNYWQIQDFHLAGLWNTAEARFGGKSVTWFINQHLTLKHNIMLLVFGKLSEKN